MSTSTAQIAAETPAARRGAATFARGGDKPLYLAAALAYLVMTIVTAPFFMGDTTDYVDSIMARFAGGDYKFWEFGHLFWRPLGWLVALALRPATQVFIGADTRAGVTLALVWLDWLSGLAAVLGLLALLRLVCRPPAALAGALALVFANGFCNYAQTGSSYVPGLAFLILGFYFMARDREEREGGWRAALLGGGSLWLAVCFWFLYIWALPAALLAGVALRGSSWARWRTAIKASFVLAALVGLSYLVVLLHLGIHTPAALRHWISPDGAPSIQGVPRAVFGFARSLVNMGGDGVLVKRYMLRDPLNPVSLADLLRLSLWKLAVFYVALAAAVVSLLRSAQGRRVLALFVLNAVPVMLFAVVFLGGDLERYFPLYPSLFLALAYGVDLALAPREARAGRRVTLAARSLAVVPALLSIVMVISTLSAAALPVMNGQRDRTAARIEPLRPLLKPGSVVYAVNIHDELVNFDRSFPFDPVNRDGGLRVRDVIAPNAPWGARWRENFARSALDAWAAGGDVWLSKRAYADRPLPEWNWVEGDDKRVTWQQVCDFLRALQAEGEAGGADGFVRVTPSERNKEYLQGFASSGEEK